MDLPPGNNSQCHANFKGFLGFGLWSLRLMVTYMKGFHDMSRVHLAVLEIVCLAYKSNHKTHPI